MALHVDYYLANPLAGTSEFKRRLPLDDPMLVAPDGKPTQLAVGWATYGYVSEPHEDGDCPHVSPPLRDPTYHTRY